MHLHSARSERGCVQSARTSVRKMAPDLRRTFAVDPRRKSACMVQQCSMFSVSRSLIDLGFELNAIAPQFARGYGALWMMCTG